MVHSWMQATDRASFMIQVVLLDPRQAFDLLDHSRLAAKSLRLRIPCRIVGWV